MPETADIDAYPLVSLITPAYQSAAFLETAIQSVLTQDYPRIEYFVIDGGSTDGSQEILRAYQEKLAGWVSEPDRGQAQAINKGLQRASGELLGWLNADDLLAPDAVSRAVSYLRAHPEVDLVYGRVQRIDFQGLPVNRPHLPANPPLFGQRTLLADRFVVQPGSLWRRDAMQQIGLLDESYQYVMDYDFWVRLALNGARFARLEGEPLASFRLQAGSKTVINPLRFWEEELRVLQRLAEQTDSASRLGLTPGEFRRLHARAVASTCLRIARGSLSGSAELGPASVWFWKAVRYYPPVLLVRWKWLLIMLREALSFRNAGQFSGTQSSGEERK